MNFFLMKDFFYFNLVSITFVVLNFFNLKSLQSHITNLFIIVCFLLIFILILVIRNCKTNTKKNVIKRQLFTNT